MSEYFKRLSIRNKIICIVTINIIIPIVLSFVILNRSFGIYDNMIYRQSSILLDEVTNNITHELERYEQMSMSIMTNRDFQTYAYKINNSPKSFEKYQAVSEMKKELKQWVNILPNVMFLSYIDAENVEYSYPSFTERLSIGEIIANEARENGKQSFWYTGIPNNILYVQCVRNIENAEAYNEGYFVICVDLTESIDLAQSRNDEEIHLDLIICDNNRIINLNSSEKDIYMNAISELDEKKDYNIQMVGGVRCFIVESVSKHTGWKFIQFMPFEEIARKIWSLRLSAVAMYIVLGCVMLLLTRRVINIITNNITKLVNKMDRVKNGDFSVANESRDSYETKDEIELLHREFDAMTVRLDTLINENYKSQAVISDTKLKALQAQIDPHFLYNTLDTINWMARIKKENEIAGMIKALANLMRNSFSIEETEITVEKEMTLVQNYIDIQKVRHDGKLKFTSVVSSEAKLCHIPKFSIQPIVENAVKYCVEKKKTSSHIEITAYVENKMLVVNVTDDGPGISGDDINAIYGGKYKCHGNGIGLLNIDTRIKMIYGESYGIRIKSVPNEKTEIGFTVLAE